MLNTKFARARLLSRGISVFQPRHEYGPTYWEKKQHNLETKLARKRNAQLYDEKQDLIDLDYVRRPAIIRTVRRQRVPPDDQACPAAAHIYG
jgi:hypothetical protein